MAYSAFAEMRKYNQQRFGQDIGPMQPKLYRGNNPYDLKSSALRFLHKHCENLRFDPIGVEEEMNNGNLRGRSLKFNQIPLNMEKDIDRLCLEKALEEFIDSGTSDDAYSVYFCFLEMFVGPYGKSKRMIEMLSEYETNGSSLLMKHRDHYSHSVYVFALGLAIYENTPHLRSAYKKTYRLKTQNEAANHFLQYWGLTSLFHDIGYPFELPFEQVESYFENCLGCKRKGLPFIAYHDMENFVRISEEESEHFKKLYGKDFVTLDELAACKLSNQLGKTYGISEEKLKQTLMDKATRPETFGYFMDHGYFSMIRLYRELVLTMGIDSIDDTTMDSLMAILLHNSLYKFVIADNYRTSNKPAFAVELNPLAWLLMLCDELQCWDRTAYGRLSRKEMHPQSAIFDFSNGKINAVYLYDINEHAKIEKFKKEFALWQSSDQSEQKPRLKEYSDMVGDDNKFAQDIRLIVNLDFIPLTVSAKEDKIHSELKHTYLSESNFMHLYDFAAAINVRRKYIGREDEIDVQQISSSFDSLSLEYKMLGLNRAKYFARYLNSIHCFYTDKPVDFEMLPNFTKQHLDKIAPLEHERWLYDRQKMGWVYGEAYEQIAEKEKLSSDEKANLREQMRCHKLALNGKLGKGRVMKHYNALSEEDKDKDSNAMNSMLKLLKSQEGVRVYTFDDITK